MNSNTFFTAAQLNSLSANDRAEVTKYRRFLKMQKTKRGRHYLKTQKYWRDYQGIS